MKVLTLLLAFCFTMNTFASTGSMRQLGVLLDEYQYAVTVEWDQKDRAFLEAQSLNFLKSVETLMQEGLTLSEIQQTIQEKGGDRMISGELLQKLQTIQGEVTPEKLAKLLTENSSSLYREGASWAPNGSSIFFTGLGILLVVEIVVLMVTQANTTCTHVSTESDGDEIWTCEL